MKKLFIYTITIVLLGLSGGLVFKILHNLLFNEAIYPVPKLSICLIYGIVITCFNWIVFTLIKWLIENFKQTSLLFDTFIMLLSNCIIFFIISRFSIGYTITGFLNYCFSFTLVSLFIPVTHLLLKKYIYSNNDEQADILT